MTFRIRLLTITIDRESKNIEQDKYLEFPGIILIITILFLRLATIIQKISF